MAYKKRVAMRGRGKRSSYRTLLAFKQDERAFFIYGFGKKMKANIYNKEAAIYKSLAKDLLNTDEEGLRTLLNNSHIIEVK